MGRSAVEAVAGTLAASALAVLSPVLLTGCGVLMPSMKSHTDLAAKNAELATKVEQQRQEAITLRADLDAARKRLDNALRANADATSEQFSDHAKLQALATRVDEVEAGLGDVKRQAAVSRQEDDSRFDELKRAVEAQANKPAPVTVPADKAAHFAALEQAHDQKDWGLTRTLGREYVARYETDDRADDALYLMGDASLREGRPASALSSFNAVLKQHPKSNVLGQTLLGMGEAYLQMHDCANAKLAYASAESRFARDAVGAEAKQKVAQIAKAPPGMCGP